LAQLSPSLSYITFTLMVLLIGLDKSSTGF
jgi:hypothetical protein